MSENNYLSLKKLISESLIRDVILFLFLFLLIIAQDWENILLLLFPLITFGFALFFKLIDINKQRIEVEKFSIIYNPLGSEKIYSHRLNFCALLQLVLLFWFGAESLYHPQLIDNYYLYFISIFIFFYTFGFYWIFFDLWNYCKIKILTEGIEVNDTQEFIKNFDNVISFMKVKNFKMISIISSLVFIILNLLNIIFAILTFNDIMPGIKYNLPGTGIENSNPINLPYTIFGIIIISPLLAITFILFNYRDITDINKEKLNQVLKPLPKTIQIKIIKNLISLNKNFKNKLKLE
jgi:hypothetical protein